MAEANTPCETAGECAGKRCAIGGTGTEGALRRRRVRPADAPGPVDLVESVAAAVVVVVIVAAALPLFAEERVGG